MLTSNSVGETGAMVMPGTIRLAPPFLLNAIAW